MPVIRMTTGQALVRFLDNQYVLFDGREEKFVEGYAAIFGHGFVVGIGQALDANPGRLRIYMGKNEQGMAHMATGFAKQHNRRRIIACGSSIGPGAANMVTAAGVATVNNIPLLLLPSDTFATRQPDPVLQQIEIPENLTVTTNDAFKAVCRYWDRVSRPEMLMTALINAMRVLTDPAAAGAVCVAMPQDVQGEAWDFPDYFFARRTHLIPRPIPPEEELRAAADMIAASRKPILVVGGGVRYSEAGEAVAEFCERFSIPMAETQAGKSAVKGGHPLNLGGIGATGNLAANRLAAEADLVIGAGTRFSDFTTASKSLFRYPGVKVAAINISRFHAMKMDAQQVVGDARAAITGLGKLLAASGYKSAQGDAPARAKADWAAEMRRLSSISCVPGFEPEVADRDPRSLDDFRKATAGAVAETAALALIRKIIPPDAIVVGASGSLPGDMQRMWETDVRDSYHMEYGYSCMGYEIAAALGAKLAEPGREVYAMAGDGSYLMLHSELVTAIQEGVKINVLLFDNAGFGCINNLQMSKGVGSLATEFRKRSPGGGLDGEMLRIDYAMSAAGYGARTYTARTLEQLETALTSALVDTVSTLIDIKTLPKTMTHGYDSWWHVGVAEVTASEKGREAYRDKVEHLKQARLY
ncbi:MAG: 3D-(3,5/4)-trihydroxycyclohexane-1,2-dione acylhydrolase (decyclizing) [Planctomycetota bacterium]|jgi:3D-(3,5/4)-trihydroxycyclohexane-1,2-dione acylhydrolase (decyclizing)|nr:3D-(3,5/4)-trihydroxycyclohexane-1,2-dione acylhydrolase (decyclizing) [Planctomycetota bacterium]